MAEVMTLKKPLLSEKRLLLLLAAVQFTHIMDFMIMMPLGPQLMRQLEISAAQFILIRFHNEVIRIRWRDVQNLKSLFIHHRTG